MADTEKKPNLYQRLLAITDEVGKIDKTGKNQQQGYAFIEHARVVAEIRAAMVKHGVMIMPEIITRRIDRFDVVRGSGKAGVDVHVNIKSRYTVINADDPMERFTCEWDGGEALDSSDKATNKAGTASHKYFLMKLFNISDQDDPDATSPELPQARTAAVRPAMPEMIKPETYAKLLSSLKLKSINDKDEAVKFLDRLAIDAFKVRAALLSEAQAKSLGNTLVLMPAEEVKRLQREPF